MKKIELKELLSDIAEDQAIDLDTRYLVEVLADIARQLTRIADAMEWWKNRDEKMENLIKA